MSSKHDRYAAASAGDDEVTTESEGESDAITASLGGPHGTALQARRADLAGL